MRGAEGIEQQHALSGLAQVPGSPGAKHARADDDGIPAGLLTFASLPRRLDAASRLRGRPMAGRDATHGT